MLVVGTGTDEEVVEEVKVVADAEQGYTEVETVDDGAAGPEGGYLDLQLDGEHLPPGQYPEQYDAMFWHQLENWKQFKESGHPALTKHDAI